MNAPPPPSWWNLHTAPLTEDGDDERLNIERASSELEME